MNTQQIRERVIRVIEDKIALGADPDEPYIVVGADRLSAGQVIEELLNDTELGGRIIEHFAEEAIRHIERGDLLPPLDVPLTTGS